MPGPGSIAQPKPEPRKRTKARAKRHESKVEQRIRAHVVKRDGFCRVGSATTYFGACEGVSELMHLEEYRRFKTRGQSAEDRHCTAGTAMGCTKHHALYDAHELKIEMVTHWGANDTLRLWYRGIGVLSVPRG